VVEYASVRFTASQTLAGLSYPPRTLLHPVGFAVTPKPPFTLAAKFDAAEYLRGSPATVTITATRDPGFSEEIALTASGQPANVAPALKNIAKGQNDVKAQFTVAANAPLGNFPITIVGATKLNGRDFSVTAAPASLVLSPPFTLAVTPIPLKVAQAGKAKIKATATRKLGYQGPITLEVRNLPANVTASKATIATGQQEAELEIVAAPAAALGNKADVNILGTAVDAANQTNASPNFTVTVEPPAAPFTLKVEPGEVKLPPGGKAKLKIVVTRGGFAGAIAIEARNLPAGVTAPKATIAMGQDAVEIELAAAAEAKAADKADVEIVGTAPNFQPAVSPKITVSVLKK
jgi:hypothetical protein